MVARCTGQTDARSLAFAVLCSEKLQNERDLTVAPRFIADMLASKSPLTGGVMPMSATAPLCRRPRRRVDRFRDLEPTSSPDDDFSEVIASQKELNRGKILEQFFEIAVIEMLSGPASSAAWSQRNRSCIRDAVGTRRNRFKILLGVK